MSSSTESPKIYSIREITSLIKRDLESNFVGLWITGEISNFRRGPTGHSYFQLKDESAVISVVMFKGMASKFDLVGMFGLTSLADLDDHRIVQAKVAGKKVNIFGSIGVYEKNGSYQIIAQVIEAQGIGALQIRFEELKRKLAAKGYFDQSRKRKLPPFPTRIGIITSPTGAAIRDMLNILKRRWPDLHIILYPAIVQGAQAAEDIANGIELFNHYGNVDIIIAGRGGGSIEDLWAFNEEIVADAIFRSKIPVVSAVGHEIDFTIADFTADMRAPTPSAAAELVVKVESEVKDSLEEFGRRLKDGLHSSVQLKRERLFSYSDDRLKRSLLHTISIARQRLKACSENKLAQLLNGMTAQYDLKLGYISEKLEKKMRDIVADKKNGFLQLLNKLNLLDPFNILKRGYSVTYEMTSGQIARDGSALAEGALLRTVLCNGEVLSRVDRGEKK